MSAAAKPKFYRMVLADFRRTGFVGRPPSINTLKAAIQCGEWGGEKIGGLWYVFVDEDGQPIPGKRPAAPPTPATGNSVADALIMDYLGKRP